MDEIERLRFRLQTLEREPLGHYGQTFHEMGNRLVEIAKLNLDIAELLLRKPFEDASWHS